MTGYIPGSQGIGCAETGLFFIKTNFDQSLIENVYGYLEKLQNPFKHLRYVNSNAQMSVQCRYA